MRRAVGYSRFSTDLQNEKSIADQETLIRRYADHHDFQIMKLYSDAAQSGASIFGREGLLELLADAKAGKFDAVIVEELDRLSRDMEDLAGIHKRLSFQNIEIIAVHEGTASTVTVGLRGLVGQLFREDNARKVRRGLQGLVKKGLTAGGKAYGYKPDPANKGKPQIVPEEAEIVVRIFEEFAAGRSPRAIAHDLTREKVPTPRSDRWTASAIFGWAERGSGILRNQLYAGKLVWNKVRMIKDPDTGKRISRPNPPDEWHTQDVPELRIVPQELFDRVQAMIQPTQKPASETGAMKRPQRMLSGLIKCGSCGGGMAVKGKDKSGRVRIECSRHHESRACPDPQTMYLDKVENAVVSKLRKELADPDLLVDYVKAYNEARQEFARAMLQRRATLERRIKELDGEVSRLLGFIAKGIGDQDRIEADYGAKSLELREARQELSMEPEPINPVTLHPAALKAYHATLTSLADAINNRLDAGYVEIGKLLRELVHGVIVSRGREPGSIDIVLQGKLRALLSAPAIKRVGGGLVAEVRYGRSPHQNAGGTFMGGGMVAGVRYHGTPHPEVEPLWEARIAA